MLPTSIKRYSHMRKILLTILTIGLIQLSVNAQFFKNTILKTRPYQDFVAYNPTIGIEKPIKKIYSLEIEIGIVRAVNGILEDFTMEMAFEF